MRVDGVSGRVERVEQVAHIGHSVTRLRVCDATGRLFMPGPGNGQQITIM